MKKRIMTLAGRMLLTVPGMMAICALCGCSARDSGLYRINAAETAEASFEIDTPDEPEAPVYVYVHVCGAVADPGVYELTPDTRIFGAVEAAGGFTEDAAQDYVNLAEPVADGMKITIPTADEVAEAERSGEAAEATLPDAIEYPGTSGQTHADGTATSGGPDTSSGSTGTLININTADESELMRITGVGATRAAAIVAYRTEHGGFASTEDIKNVSGIGEATYNKLKDEITVR